MVKVRWGSGNQEADVINALSSCAVRILLMQKKQVLSEGRLSGMQNHQCVKFGRNVSICGWTTKE